MERDKRKKSKIPCLFGGNGENLNRKTVQARSQRDGFTQEKMFMYEAGQTSSKQVYGTPMKTLLAKEMLNETTVKRRSPSLIAKLMGLDGLPSPQPLHRQQKKASENSKSTAKRNEKSFNHQSDRKTTMDQQHFKDVYEDPEASHVGNQLYSPQYTAKRRSTKMELGYIQERCDEMLRESIAIKTKLERVDSNSDLMLGFLHKDQRDSPYGSVCNHITVLKPSNAVRHGSNGKVLKEAVNYRVPVSHQRNEDGHLGYSCHSNHNSRKPSRYQPERKEANAISPTRIVVLKPNVAKMYSDTESELYKGPPSEFRSSRHKSKEARDIARQITSQMKEGFESGQINLFESDFMEYASASASESELMAVSSRNSFHQSARAARPRRSRSNMSESAVIKEAKKRMSQRWKNHGYKDMGMLGKSSTLEEMLSVPNSDTRHSKTGYSVGPVGVNDEYGWRDEHLINTSRSRSLSPSSCNRSHKTSNYREANVDEKIMVHNEPVIRGKSKGVKGQFSHREESRSVNFRSYSERCQSCQNCNARSHEFGKVSPTETCFENEDPVKQALLISDIQNVTMKPTSVIDVCMLGDADTFSIEEDSLNLQEPWTANSQGAVCSQLSGPELESSEGSKEFDQHGQTSVFEVPLTEDVSSGSECFERVSSQLHELRKQLHLLKMESGSHYDSPNDEETEQRSSSFTVSDSEHWESTYLTDLLHYSGFYDHDPFTFITTFYSLDCPIDPCLFDHLEKKYSQDPTVSRSERRLFHDRVNEAMCVLSTIMLSSPLGQRGMQITLIELGFEDQLQKLLSKQEKEANEEFEDISMDNDLDWFQPVSEIDVLGKQIAEMLVNELVLETTSG
ncbi:hypothetical protein M8C21_000437 [Ambrosia artemisiifolia]|uniref:DUF4378 domain-containing protein n=1 Tax=Ambrosia artemisiifolia TaxID=4212 RepID=A0AAD5CRB4_AMBAR|nr:hypothetical protein M8C21_000437 [Ambrosia artemisiifolia]